MSKTVNKSVKNTEKPLKLSKTRRKTAQNYVKLSTNRKKCSNLVKMSKNGDMTVKNEEKL